MLKRWGGVSVIQCESSTFHMVRARIVVVVVVGFYDTFKHLRSSASLPS